MIFGRRVRTSRTARTTTSAIGEPAAAFTLLEVLLCLALIALFAAVLVGGSAKLLESGAATPREVFWKACQEARRMALTSGQDARLGFDEKTLAFTVDCGGRSKRLAISRPPSDLKVSFLPGQSQGSSVLLGGTLTETGDMAGAEFYDDGTCEPFRVQFESKGAAGAVAVDPWTCAPLLAPPGGA